MPRSVLVQRSLPATLVLGSIALIALLTIPGIEAADDAGSKLPAATVLPPAANDPAAASKAAELFQKHLKPYLTAHCIKCHGDKDPEADLKLHNINGDVAFGPDIDHWKIIAERIALGEMPPEDQPRPDAKLTAAVLTWVKDELTRGGEDASDIGHKLHLPGHGNRIDHAALFAADPNQPGASPSRLWRLSPQIYLSFIPRVVGKGHKASGQPFSSSSAEGFKDFSDLFVVDEPTIGQMMRNATKLAEIQCGLANGSKPIKQFEALVKIDSPPSVEQTQAALRHQFQLATLREPTAAELSNLMELMKKNVADAGHIIGVKTTLAAVLMTPESFYRFEVGDTKRDAQGRRMLQPRELAYAIAFGLTDEPPDATLLKAASSGQLKTREDVAAQVQRILEDKSIAKPRIMRFFDEYFEYPHAEEVFKDLGKGKWYPEVLINDTRYLIQHILDKDRDVLKELLTTNESFVNYKLVEGKPAVAREEKKKAPPKLDPKTGKPKAPLGKPTPQTHEWYNFPAEWEWTAEQPLKLPAEERSGILTQPSWLAAFATNDETHAIRRGKWVRERMLGGVVPDIPISVDAQLPNTFEKTIRERMLVTTEKYCWQCHQKMNPIGLTFENYDFMGRFRKTELVVDLPATEALKVKSKKENVDPIKHEVPLVTEGKLENSGDPKFDGPLTDSLDLIKRLAGSAHVRQVFVRHAFRYWMGRNETLDDGTTMVRADQAYVKSGGSMNALIASLLTSDAFLYRK